jgi:hypothetical protein
VTGSKPDGLIRRAGFQEQRPDSRKRSAVREIAQAGKFTFAHNQTESGIKKGR